MNLWFYELLGRDGSVVARDTGFETESEAEAWGSAEARSRSLSGYTVRTGQEYQNI